jgi:hypothetical protein
MSVVRTFVNVTMCVKYNNNMKNLKSEKKELRKWDSSC